MARINKCVSMDPIEIERLQWICSDTGMKEADVIRELINKAYIDKYCRQIITKENFTKKAIKAKMGKTSHNVHYENEEKSDSSHEEPPTAVSYNCRVYDSVIPPQNQYLDKMDPVIENTLRIAKVKWVDGYTD